MTGGGRWEKGIGQLNEICKENTQGFYTFGRDLSQFLPKVSSSLISYKIVTGPGRTAVGLSRVSLSGREKGGAGAPIRTWTAQADQHLVSVPMLLDCCQLSPCKLGLRT